MANTLISPVEQEKNVPAPCMSMEAQRRINNKGKCYMINELPLNVHCLWVVGRRRGKMVPEEAEGVDAM